MLNKTQSNGCPLFFPTKNQLSMYSSNEKKTICVEKRVKYFRDFGASAVNFHLITQYENAYRIKK